MTPRRFKVQVRQTRIATVYEWVDGRGMDKVDEAAAVARAEAAGEWSSVTTEVVSLHPDEPEGRLE